MGCAGYIKGSPPNTKENIHKNQIQIYNCSRHPNKMKTKLPKGLFMVSEVGMSQEFSKLLSSYEILSSSEKLRPKKPSDT
jgi:hypothetical protein